MAVRNPRELVSFDAERALEVALDATDDQLLACAEYTTDEFNAMYIGEGLLAAYEDPEEVLSVGEGLHRYLHLDFEEQGLFKELYPSIEEAYGFVTYTDFAIIARVISDGEGLYLSLPPGADVTGVVEAVRAVVAESSQPD